MLILTSIFNETMRNVYIESTNVITSLGFTTDENMTNILNEKSGLKMTSDSAISPDTLPVSRIDNVRLAERVASIGGMDGYTRLEQIAVSSMTEALSHSGVDVRSPRCLLIVSSTKGNVGLLTNDNVVCPPDEVYLWHTAQLIARHFGMANEPQIVSNACISGLVASVVGRRLINAGLYDSVVVLGVDVLSRFVVSGFQSFKSVSANPCKPYDKNRDGLSVGEGAATVILTCDRGICGEHPVEIVSGATTNDANHISGPSRTGEGLYRAICRTMKGHESEPVSFISAHGTATLYNDDMESKAIMRASMSSIPVVGVKGYIGHTLGAAGAIETALGVESIRRGTMIRTLGYSEFGVAEPITVSDRTVRCDISSMLKIASGFGGCNAAALFVKR